MGLLERCLHDAILRWTGKDVSVTDRNLASRYYSTHAFPQYFSTAGWAFGRPGTQREVVLLTVVVVDEGEYRAAIYFNGEHVYDVAYESGDAQRIFFKRLREYRIPAVSNAVDVLAPVQVAFPASLEIRS